MKPFVYVKPSTASHALTSKEKASQFIAGGTNILDLMKKDISQPDSLLDITSALSDKITVNGNGISIGAMVRNSSVANDKSVVSRYPLIAKSILAGASPQIRNMASTAGNLLQRTRCPYFYDITMPCNKRKPGSGCSAIDGNKRMSAIVGWSENCVAVHPSDFCISLAALDASVVITDKSQRNITIPFKDFHRLPGANPEKDNTLPDNALIISVDIPSNDFHKNYSYLKVRDRDSYAFALISVAAALKLDNKRIISARLASGGVAHKPWRWYAAEQYLQGKQATPATFRDAAELIAKETRPLEDNRFKVKMLQGAVEVALQNCLKA